MSNAIIVIGTIIALAVGIPAAVAIASSFSRINAALESALTTPVAAPSH